MVELCLVQRASMLKFSSEVARVSRLSSGSLNKIVDEVNSLYKDYIRFVNKIYFREITTQDQGIETYNKLQEVMEIKDHVNDLDSEIEELHKYASMLEEKSRSRNLALLTKAATVIVLPSLIIAYFGISIFNPAISLDAAAMYKLNGTVLLIGTLVYVLIEVQNKIVNALAVLATIATLIYALFELPKLFNLF